MLKSTEGNDYIREKIKSNVPFIATKFGGVEQSIIVTDRNYHSGVRFAASNNAGITPSDDENMNYFFDEYVKSMSNIDVLGNMNINENQLIPKYCPNVILSELRFLEPFYFDNPWSELLENKNVLVIHPFEDSIKKQYKKREVLFKNKKILPKFNLLTLKAEQTNGGGKSNNKTFIESMKLMKQKIDLIDFDIAIIGCGAYGLPLSSYIKNKGKQAIHIGGGLQILFGIKGKRWDVHPEISSLYNDEWIRPSEDEKTINYGVVEGGTYW